MLNSYLRKNSGPIQNSWVKSLLSEFSVRIPLWQGSKTSLNSHNDPMKQMRQSHMSDKRIGFMEVHSLGHSRHTVVVSFQRSGSKLPCDVAC